MHQKWKEMTGEFSKKSKTNTEKTYEKYGKISYVFSGTSEILSQSEKSDFGMRGVKVVKAKSAKSQGRRARHTRVRKSLNEGGQNGTKATCHFIRQSSEGNTQVARQKSAIFAKYTKQFNLHTKKKRYCPKKCVSFSVPLPFVRLA